MTDKEYIEKMIDAFEKQGRFAIGDTDSCKCMYRTRDGLKCIVGQGIDDTFYRESLETSSVRNGSILAAINDSFNKAGGSGLLPQVLLQFLQEVHDSEYFRREVSFEKVVEIMREEVNKYYGGKINECNK